MTRTLHFLFVEDKPEDAELEERELKKAGLSMRSQRVETAEALQIALQEFKPDIVLSDFSLPQLDGLTALKLVRERSSEIPFIFISGTIGEERAIESLKSGATDYIIKDNLGGLVIKVNRALREVQERANHKRVEEELRQAQKMEVVGRLAGGIAHDFNNLLTVINGYSQLILNLPPPEGPIREHAEEILRAGERAASLTRQLLMFSRKHILAPAVVSLNSVVTQAVKMLRRLIGEDIELLTSLDPGLGNVMADPGQMEQVMMNLSLNARDAMPTGGKLILETANVSLDQDYVREHPGAKEGPHVMLSVTDTGLGMNTETVSHLFEPFFTTKEPGKGTGLGLSTVYGIVKGSGGTIGVNSEPGHGTTFKVYLPRVDDVPSTVRPSTSSTEGTRGMETVLLVEDSEPVRKLMVGVLSQNGYQVLAAENGKQALRALAGLTGTLHLLITDVILPEMSGPEIAYLVDQARPGTRILFTSGYTDREVLQKGVLQSGVAFLQKPFDSNTLTRKVREVLGTPA